MLIKKRQLHLRASSITFTLYPSSTNHCTSLPLQRKVASQMEGDDF
jgi:hypothetical protein